MALTSCKECGNQVSTTAGRCPRCGAKVSKSVSRLTIVFVALLGLLALKVLLSGSTTPPVSAPQKTAAQIADDARKQARFERTVAAAISVKTSMRDPESLQWEEIFADDKGNVICLAYRARNGFGGINKEFVVYVDGKPTQKVEVWNKRCRANLYDMKYVRGAIP